MPIEVRHLIFEESEVATALVGYMRRTRQARSATVADLRLDDYPEIMAYLTLRMLDGAIEVLRFTPAQLAAALILHCRHSGIPLPARATKSVKVLDRGLRLSLSLNAPASLRAALGSDALDTATAAR